MLKKVGFGFLWFVLFFFVFYFVAAGIAGGVFTAMALDTEDPSAAAVARYEQIELFLVAGEATLAFICVVSWLVG